MARTKTRALHGGSRRALAHSALGLQGLQNGGRNKPFHLATQGGNFSDQGAADVLYRGTGVQKDGVNFGCQMPIHTGHLRFVVVVSGGAQASHNDTRALALHKIAQ